MLTATYILATLVVFSYLSETESQAMGAPLSQRQLVLIAGAALVWPLVGLGLLYESRRELFDNLRVLLDLELDMGQLMQDLNWHPEANLDAGLDGSFEGGFEGGFEVDPDTL